MEPLSIIHVGVGGRGRSHVRGAAASGYWRPVALVDAQADALAAARELTGLPESACFTRLEEALAAVPSDAVSVASPVRFHAEQIGAALAAGRHVLTEKCFTVGLAEAEACVARAEAAGLRLMVVQNMRYSPPARTLRRLVAEEAYGPLGLFLMSFFKARGGPYHPSPHMHLWQQAVHELDTLLSVVQQPLRRVWGLSNHPAWCDWPSPSTVQAIAEFDAGVSGTYVATSNARSRGWEFRLECAEATLLSPHREGGPLIVRWGPGEKREEAIPLDTPEVRGLEHHPRVQELLASGGLTEAATTWHGLFDLQIYRDFQRYVTAGEEPETSRRRNLETLRFLDAIQRSTEEGRPVTLTAGTSSATAGRGGRG